MPFVECGAMSQGYIGFHLQNALQNALRKKHIDKNVSCVVTQVEVDPLDSAFNNPTKPIGSFYSKEDAEKLPFPVKEDAGRGYRRVIASPKPKSIIELNTIEKLVASGDIVITCGGGGIPVIKDGDEYKGIDAVIDKDFASSLLANMLDADLFFILTAVPNAALNFNTPLQKELYKVPVEEMKQYLQEGHFKEGSMKPKVDASIAFVEAKCGRIAIITSIEEAGNALTKEVGTKIYH